MSCSKWKQQTPVAATGAPNGLASLDLDFYKRLLDQLHDAVYFVDSQTNYSLLEQGGGAADRVLRDRGHQQALFRGLLEHAEAFWLRPLSPGMPPGASMRQERPVHERLFLRHKDGRRISVDVADHARPQ